MSTKLCDNCNMIMINYVNLCIMHSHVASLLDGAMLKLGELKTRSTLSGACTSCPLFRSDLEALHVEIKDLKHKLDHSSRYTILSPPYETCVSLKGKFSILPKRTLSLSMRLLI
jgi:hypothetical protein